MKNIIIQGFYGMGNLGDEAILSSFIESFHGIENTKIKVISRDPENVNRIHGLDSISEFGKFNYIRCLLSLINSDLYVLGGGGLIKDYGNSPNSLKRWLRFLNFANAIKKKTGLFAIGVENIRYNESKKAIKKIFNRVDVIMVRDQQSKDNLQSFGVTNPVIVVSDPALLLCKNKKVKKVNVNSPKVLFCVRHWFDEGNYISDDCANNNLLKVLSSAADYLIDRYNAEIHFYPLRTHSPDDDRIIANRIVDKIQNKNKTIIHSSVPSVWDFINILDQFDLVIGMRLHSMILSSGLGIPGIALAYMPKVNAFMESIHQERYSLDLKTLSYEKIVKAIEETFMLYQERSERIIKHVRLLQETTQDGINNLADLIRGE